MMPKKIALVTPLKNEIANIDRLIESVNNQSIVIFCWIIVENDSDDGSKERLASIVSLSNVLNFEVIQLPFEDKEYRLGTKYSTIVKHGFEYVKKQKYYNELDYVGILDSDCFPERGYYEGLIDFMGKDEKLGISSGLSKIQGGKVDLRNENWVRGNCRLWKIKCFETSGYIIGPSADSISACKAILKGWKVYPNKNIFVETRDLGGRVNFNYYGYANYFIGHTPLYAILKFAMLLKKGKHRECRQYFWGYWRSYVKAVDRIQDREVLLFYRFYMLNKIKTYLKLV